MIKTCDEFLGGLVEFRVGGGDLVFGLLLQALLHHVDVRHDLCELALGLVKRRVVFAIVGVVGVDDGDDVVDDLDNVLDNGLGGGGDAEVV